MDTDEEYEILVTSDQEPGDLLNYEIGIGRYAFAELIEPPPYKMYVYWYEDKELWDMPFDVFKNIIREVKERADRNQPKEGNHDDDI